MRIAVRAGRTAEVVETETVGPYLIGAYLIGRIVGQEELRWAIFNDAGAVIERGIMNKQAARWIANSIVTEPFAVRSYVSNGGVAGGQSWCKVVDRRTGQTKAKGFGSAGAAQEFADRMNTLEAMANLARGKALAEVLDLAHDEAIAEDVDRAEVEAAHGEALAIERTITRYLAAQHAANDRTCPPETRASRVAEAEAMMARMDQDARDEAARRLFAIGYAEREWLALFERGLEETREGRRLRAIFDRIWE